jgi:DNA-binding IclR family transcriptional regulator
MGIGLDPNKAKTARRVIEVLEFFDEQNRYATVMDIARRYNRPQSSTSELLTILVEMGVLYKDAASRSYKPTPRAAMLGSLCQPNVVRDGRVAMLTDRLVAQTGLGTAFMGMVGLQVQLFRWLGGAKPVAGSIHGGLQQRLCESAAGWLLLSTLPPERREGVIRRLRAESPEDRKFSCAALSEKVQECGRRGYVVGPAGFSPTADMCAVPMPSEPGERPMLLGFIYEPSEEIDPASLVALLQRSVQSCVSYPGNPVSVLNSEPRAAKLVTASAA